VTTTTFLGSGAPTGTFNIDHFLLEKTLLQGEARMWAAFPFPALETWRRTALEFTAATPTTGGSDIATRARTTLLYAHEADLGAIFRSLTGSKTTDLQGYYVDKRKAKDVDASLTATYGLLKSALVELQQQKVPDQDVNLILSRLTSTVFNHRVAGLCAAVYLTALIQE